MPTEFTPYSALAGGLLIGLAATLLYAGLGRIAGVGGVLNHALEHRRGRSWRLVFLLCVVASAAAWFLLGHDAPAARTGFPVPWLVAAGLLVGFGARLDSGRADGHGIRGLAPGSRRSTVALAVSMLAAAATLFVLRHLLGGIA